MISTIDSGTKDDFLQEVAHDLQNDVRTCANGNTPVTQRRSDPVPGRVYFIQGGGFIKIGYSTKVNLRFSQLQSSCPFELKLLGDFPGTKKDELDIMFMFAHLNVRGEWFQGDLEIHDYIRKRAGKKWSRRRGKPGRNSRDWLHV